MDGSYSLKATGVELALDFKVGGNVGFTKAPSRTIQTGGGHMDFW